MNKQLAEMDHTHRWIGEENFSWCPLWENIGLSHTHYLGTYTVCDTLISARTLLILLPSDSLCLNNFMYHPPEMSLARFVFALSR